MTETYDQPILLKRASSNDSFILGHTQEQKGSEFQSGARAELTPSPLTLALSSIRGRFMAQAMIFMVPDTRAHRFIAARSPMLKAAILRAMPQKPQPILATVAVGFSPVTILIAQERPDVRVIEIDTPEVIQKRKTRLRHAPDIIIPDNIETYKADLATVPLSDVLGDIRPDVMDITGGYFTHAELTQVVRYFAEVMSDEGACVCYLPWFDGIEQIKGAARFFKSQIGDYPGMVGHVDTAKRIFTDAGYQTVEVLFPSQFGAELGLETPMMDIEILVIAYKQKK